MEQLNDEGYSIFVRDIRRVGYEKRTSKRSVFFNPLFKINESTFEVEVDSDGMPLRDEEFSETIADFRSLAAAQEEVLQRLFLKAAIFSGIG